MESEDSCDGYAEAIPPGSGAANLVYQPCEDFQHDNLVTCSSAPPSMMPLINQMQPGMMTMQDPNTGEQIVVVQSMNGEDSPHKAIINAGALQNQLQMAKFNNSNAGMLQHLANTGQMLAPTQLAGMMNLAGLPQVAALGGLNGLQNFNVMNQMAAQPMMQQAGGQAQCMTNAPNVQQQGMVTVNNQPNSVQQTQVGNTPQFILAGGQPIQGIQGAQLLIPTSSGGMATQQVITIPVSQLAGNQIVQLVASNGQIFTTTLANLQALSQPVPVPGVQTPNMNGTPQPVQSHTMLPPGYTNVQGQIATMPQIYANAAGQLVTLGPQMITHPMMGGNPTNLMVNPQITTQLQQVQQQQQQPEDKSLTAVTSSGQPMNRIQNSSLNAISQAIAMQQQQQQQHATQMALNPAVIVTTQLPTLKAAGTPQNCLVAPKLPLQQGSTVSTLTQTAYPQPSVSPDDDCDNGLNQIVSTISNTEANVVDGINLEEIKDFAKAFKIRRLSLGLTQTQVGQALSATEGPSYSQSAICRFEKLDITPRSAQKIKPVLERWMHEAEERYASGAHTLTEFMGSEPAKKRKRRTSFTPSAIDLLTQFFEKNTHPSGAEMTSLAEHLHYDREVVRVWFCNRRQMLKNSIKKLKNP